MLPTASQDHHSQPTSSLISALLAAGVQVGVGLLDESEAQPRSGMLFLLYPVTVDANAYSQLALGSNGTIDRTTVLALAIVTVVGVAVVIPQDLVAYKGGCVFGFEGKSVAVISARFGRTDLFKWCMSPRASRWSIAYQDIYCQYITENSTWTTR